MNSTRNCGEARGEFDALLADIRARAGEFERNKRISQDIIEKFKKIGVYRALFPRPMAAMKRPRNSSC